MKILVKAYTAQNLGDDLFLKILTDKYPQIQFSLIGECHNGIYSRYSQLKLISVISRIFRKVLSWINRSFAEKYTKYVIRRSIKNSVSKFDGVIIIGGSMFIQKQKGLSLDDTIKSSIIEYFPHSFVIGANFGPYEENEYLANYKSLLKKCDKVTLRDKYSFNLLGRMSNSAYYPDVVFQLKQNKKNIIPNSVGISVIDLFHRGNLSLKENEYIKFITDIINNLYDSGKKIYLYSFCKMEGDETAINKIVSKIDHKNIRIVRYDGDIESFLDIYSSMEAMFCSRFHSMILSLLYSHKMVPLIYSRKMTQVLEDIHYDGLSVDIEKIEKYEASNVIESLYSNNYIFSEFICQNSEGMFSGFEKFIRDNKTL